MDNCRDFVEIPGLGSVYVRGLSGWERDEFHRRLENGEAKTAWVVARAVVNEVGERLFSDDDVERIGRLSFSMVGVLAESIYRLSGMTKEYEADAVASLRGRPELKFWHRLALQLGMSVKRAQQEIDAAEFAHWMAFYRLEPWGRDVEDRPAALVASTIANVNRPKSRKAYKVEDFMLRYDREEKQDWREQSKMLQRLTVALGGEVH